MRIRPVDQNGDVLPVLHASDLFSGSLAVAKLVEDRLNLFSGDWWEDPAFGNDIFDLVSASAVREQDLPALAGDISSYIQSFPPVHSVSDVRASLFGRSFLYSATAHISGDGAVPVSFSYP